MKVLYIVEISIEHTVGGGGDNVRKAYYALKDYCAENHAEFGVVSLSDTLPECLPFVLKKTWLSDRFVRLAGHSNFLFFFWEKAKNAILAYKPDVIVLGRSRYGFMARDIKQLLPSCKVVSVFENVEIDYVKAYFTKKRGLSKLAYVALESCVVKRDEHDCIKYSDAHVFLSKRDKERATNIYGDYRKRTEIIPICLCGTTELYEKSLFPLNISTTHLNRQIVFHGSLWYDANIESVEWLLENIVTKFEERKNLGFIFAGSRPSNSLKERIKLYQNVTLYENYKRPEDIIPARSLFVSPTFSGAGMKVKVADALSMGLMVVASDEALVGYEDVKGLRGVVRANTVEEYSKAIDDWLAINEIELREIEKENKAAFSKLYSYQRAKNGYASLLKSLMNDI